MNGTARPRRWLFGLWAGVVALTAVTAASPARAADDLTQWVDPFIGTYPPGFTNPGPFVPHGLVHVGPDTEGPLNYGGYFSINTSITGFSHVHMSAGVFQGGSFPLMPVVGPILPLELPGSDAAPPIPGYLSPFDKVTEVAEPGYYAVDLLRYGIRAELTATERAGLHRWSFPPLATPSLVFHPGRDLKGLHEATVTVLDERTIVASVSTTGPDHVVHAALRVDRPVTVTTLDGAPLVIGESVTAEGLGVVLLAPGEPILTTAMGVSFTDQQGALANLAAEADGRTFDEVRASAADTWNEALHRIEVTGGSDQERTSFYSALYRVQQFPNLLSDADGRYMGADEAVRRSDAAHYSQFSLWDSYRGQNALLAVINPHAYRDMLASLRDFGLQGERLPRWQLAYRDPGYMSGNPVIQFIVSGVCRDVAEPALERELYELGWQLRETERDPLLDQLGYLPAEHPGNPTELIEGGGGRHAGQTLEYGVADAALALWAGRLGEDADALTAVEGAGRWRNLVDADGWIHPRTEGGEFTQPFLPESGYGFQEGTAWQYSWLVMHDYAGLIEAMGGPDVVRQRLDTLFAFPLTGTIPVVWPKLQNQATAFGVFYFGNQYAPGNEHDLEAPYVYNWAGAPWQTQAVARGTSSLFTPTIDGLPGNDDLGALSGWLVWTMLGLHPVVPGAPGYTIGAPTFERAVVHRPAGDLVVEAPGANAVTRFVTAAALDDQPLDGPWFTEGELDNGGTLALEMSAAPGSTWGVNQTPPSFSTHALEDFGCVAAAGHGTLPATKPPVPAEPLPATGGGLALLAFVGLLAVVLERPAQLTIRPSRRSRC